MKGERKEMSNWRSFVHVRGARASVQVTTATTGIPGSDMMIFQNVSNPILM